MKKEKKLNHIFQIRIFKENDTEFVVELWKRCGLVVTWNDPYLDIQRKLAVQREMFLVGLIKDRIAATVMGGYDGHRGWLNYLAVDPEYRYCGFGAALVKEAEKRLAEYDCPKVNLQVRTSNKEVIAFYRSLGYEIDDVVGLGKRIIADS